MSHQLFKAVALAATVLSAPAFAATEYLTFTTSGSVALPSTKVTGTAGGKDGCLIGSCPQQLSFNTATGGKLTVSGRDNLPLDGGAYVQQGGGNTGLGVVSGSTLLGAADLNPSVSFAGEYLVLTFSKPVVLKELWFFPDDTGNNSELDEFDEFLIGVDGKPEQRAFFGVQNGQPRVLPNGGYAGTSFTLGYSSFSPEDFYLGAIGIAPIPEPSTYALMGLGLAGAAWVARRRRA